MVAIDKVIAVVAKEQKVTAEARDAWIQACHNAPDDPTTACVVAAKDDAAVEACIQPKPKGEPRDQLEASVESLRTVYFVHETFSDKNVPLTPAKSCCSFPSKKCPVEAKPPFELADLAKIDFTKERSFQYRYESTANTAVLEAVGARLRRQGRDVSPHPRASRRPQHAHHRRRSAGRQRLSRLTRSNAH